MNKETYSDTIAVCNSCLWQGYSDELHVYADYSVGGVERFYCCPRCESNDVNFN